MSGTPIGWYKWYPRDFATSIVVRSMSFTARSIYRELLDIQWESGCLPNAKRLLSVIGANAEQWNEFAPYLDELFPNGVNPKLETMRIEAVERQGKRKEAGSKGGQSKQKPTKRKANAKQVLSQTETETETDIDTKVSKDKPLFAKPTVQEVTQYMIERQFPNPELEAVGFIAHYDGNGWKTGKNPVKDWKGCVRTFEVTMKRDGKWSKDSNQKKELYHD